MGYFANGTEGEMYEERYCNNCVHGQGEGCAVWLLHFVYNGEADKKGVLDTLIPRGADGRNEQCSMFIAVGEIEVIQ